MRAFLKEFHYFCHRAVCFAASSLAVLFWGAVVSSHQSAQADAFSTGVNLAGAEFGAGNLPGEHGRDYIYPDEQAILGFAQFGFGNIRLPVLWERLEPRLGAGFDDEELARLDQVVRSTAQNGMTLIIDVHNYARYKAQTAIIGLEGGPTIEQFETFWARLARRYRDNSHVAFGLMNEPHGVDADHWAQVAQRAINAIRANDAQNLILVPGTAWTGAHSWQSPVSGRSNADALRTLSDPCNNIAVEVHQYLDEDSSGTSPVCVSKTIGSQRLKPFTNWLKETGLRGYLGEFGASQQPICLAALSDLLISIERERDLWIGWSYWAAGPWWGDNYLFLVRPSDGEKPTIGAKQLGILAAYAAGRGQTFHGCRSRDH